MSYPRSQPELADLLRNSWKRLERAGVSGARREAELLLAFCLGTTTTGLYLADDEPISPAIRARFEALLERRCRREPLAYLTGEREFWSLPFTVSPAVLIPRPETEFLLEQVLARRNPGISLDRRIGCLDLCCGSGVIAVVLARELGISVLAVDLSGAALKIARDNLRRHRLLDRVQLLQADLVSCFRLRQPFSLIVANPPYVSRGELENDLEPEVADYEPRLALDGGDSGLELIERIGRRLPRLLSAGGDCFLEIGAGQGADIRYLFGEQVARGDLEFVRIYRDYAGRDRVAHLRRTE